MSIFGIYAVCMIMPVIALGCRNTNSIKSQLRSNSKSFKTSVTINNEWKTEFGINSRDKRSDGMKCPVSCGSKNLPVCYCDDICHYFNDCCLEAIESDKQTAIKVSSTKQAFSCSLPARANRASPFIKPFGFAIVRTCLYKFQFSKIARKCLQTDRTSNLLHFIPVTSTNGMTYSNIFCALCNDEEKIEFWELETYHSDLSESSSEQNLTKLVKMLASATDLMPIPSSAVRPRICIRTTTNNEDANRSELCSKYQEPVAYDNQVFRNHHCIDKNRSLDCFSHHRCQLECIEEDITDVDRYVTDRNVMNNLFRISFAIQMIYDSRKCKSGDIFYTSKVKCVVHGCLDGSDPARTENCKMFEVMYTNYKVGLSWRIKSSITRNENELQRYITLLFYILYINKFVSVIPYVRRHSYKACTYEVLNMPLAYKGILKMQELEKLNSWLDSLQITYLETYTTGNQSEVLKRVFESKRKNSKTSFQNQCTDNGFNSSSLKLPNDKELFIMSLTKYHTPFLYKYKCSHIHLTLSITDNMDESGKIQRAYKPTEFHCVNGQSVITLNILSLLIVNSCAFLSM